MLWLKLICFSKRSPGLKRGSIYQIIRFMGPTWGPPVLSAPDRPHVGPMNLAIRVYTNHWHGTSAFPIYADGWLVEVAGICTILPNKWLLMLGESRYPYKNKLFCWQVSCIYMNTKRPPQTDEKIYIPANLFYQFHGHINSNGTISLLPGLIH